MRVSPEVGALDPPWDGKYNAAPILDQGSPAVENSLKALQLENEALKNQIATLTQMVGLTLSLMRKWTAVNESDLSALCDITAQDHPERDAVDLIAQVRVLARGVHGAAPHVGQQKRRALA